MAGNRSGHPHDHCTSRRCVEWSSLFGEAEDGSANGNGKKGERVILAQLRRAGLVASMHPGGAYESLDGKGVKPDFGVRSFADGDDDEYSASYGVEFALGEGKIQVSGGSAYQKIEHSIRRYGQLSFAQRKAVIVFHMLCPVLVGRGSLEELEALAAQHRVGWIAFDDISTHRVREVTRQLNASREHAATEISEDLLAQLLDRLGPDGVGDLARYALTKEVKRKRAEHSAQVAVDAVSIVDELVDPVDADLFDEAHTDQLELTLC